MAVGYEKGYHVITLSDCLATSMEEHENAIKLNYPMFSEDEIAGLRRAAGRRGDPTALA